MGIEFLKPHLWWLALIFLGLFALLVRASYSGTSGPSQAWKRVLSVLRLAAVVLFLLALLQPVFKSFFTRQVKPELAVFIDNSISMSIRQTSDTPSIFDAAVSSYKNLSGRNSRDFSFTPYAFSDGLSAVKNIDEIKPEGGSSEPARALKSFFNSFSAEDVRGILLYTDGQFPMNSALDEILNKMRENRIRIIPVIPQRSTVIQDVAVRFTDDDPTEFYSGQQAELVLELFSRGESRNVAVSVSDNGQTLFTRQIQFPAGKQSLLTHFTYVPETEGVHRLKVSARPFPGEPFLENNSDVLFTRVNKGKYGILLVYGSLGWEYKFLKRLLEYDPGVRLRSIVRLRPGDLAGLDASSLNDTDLVVIGNTSMKDLNGPFLSALTKRIKTSGLSLLVMGGENSFMSEAVPDKSFAEILPFRNGQKFQKIEEPVPIMLTREGELNPDMLIMDDPTLNRKAWENLPPLNVVNWVEPVPGCTVLAVSLKNQKIPVMGVRQAGSGKVFFIAGASTWKWAFLNLPVNDDNLKYGSFYHQLIRDLTSSRLEKLNLVTDRYVYKKGDTVRLQAVILDDNYNPPGFNSIDAEVSLNEKSTGRVRLKNTPLSPERFTAEFPADEYGEYSAQISAAGRSRSTSFVVRKSRDELFSIGYDPDNIRRIAALSGTTTLTPDNPVSLDKLFDPAKITRKLSIRRELWNSWIVILAITSLLTLEWILRKRKGLL